jgi:hypothetical protein
MNRVDVAWLVATAALVLACCAAAWFAGGIS